MATTPDLQEPQIAAARAAAWHQTGEALLTLEAARTFLNDAGLLLFAPRGAGLGTAAPSLVEATLGAPKESASLAETATARTLVARLVGEGSAVPLNLLGGAGDLPDFLVSTQAFPFVFTLRGDKGWKRAPETSGAVKVTPLGLRIYELLVEKGALTVAEIVSEVGREVTDSAVARALGELWQILRVIPVLQQGEGETRWELLTSRFIKAVKAGANAGQPTALSGLVSHFLEQVYVASEEEIAGFLSPLTARSRVREVLHGLIAGRQLAEAVIEGKTVLYMPDALPDFAPPAPEAAEEAESEESIEEDGVESGEGEEGEAGEAGEMSEAGETGERIKRFEGGATGERNLRGKPFRREGSPAPAGDRGPRAPRSGPPREDRGGAPGGVSGGAERRPFGARPPRRDDRGAGGGFERKRPAAGRGAFSKPWEEERGARPPRRDDAGERPPRAPRDGGDRPSFGDRGPRPPQREGGGRPFVPRGGDSRPPRRFDSDRPAPRRRDEGEGAPGGGDRFSRGGDRPQRPFRPSGDRPSGFSGGERPARPSGDRPFRPSGDRPFKPSGDRPFRPSGDRPFKPSGDRPFRPSGERPARPSGDRPFRPASDRPFRPSGDRPSRPSGDRPFRPSGDRPPRPSGDRPFRPAGDRPSRPSGDRPFRPAGDRPFRPSGDRPARPFGDRPFRPSGDRPARPGGDRPFRPSGDRPARGGGDRPGGRPSFGGGGRFGDRSGAGPGAGDRRKGPGGFSPRPDGAPRPPRKPRPEEGA